MPHKKRRMLGGTTHGGFAQRGRAHLQDNCVHLRRGHARDGARQLRGRAERVARRHHEQAGRLHPQQRRLLQAGPCADASLGQHRRAQHMQLPSACLDRASQQPCWRTAWSVQVHQAHKCTRAAIALRRRPALSKRARARRGEAAPHRGLLLGGRGRVRAGARALPERRRLLRALPGVTHCLADGARLHAIMLSMQAGATAPRLPQRGS